MEEDAIRSLCTNLLVKSWPAFLTTVNSEGAPQTRAMFNLRNEERFPTLKRVFQELENGFTIIFSTNTSSSKISEIRSNPLVSVYYCLPDRGHGAMFGGRIEIVESDALKKRIWQDGWEMYYPEGYADPDHTALQLHPAVVKGWAGSQTFELNME